MTRISMRLNGPPDVTAYDDSNSCSAFLSIAVPDPHLSVTFVMSLAEQEAFGLAILEAVESARTNHHDPCDQSHCRQTGAHRRVRP